MLTKFRVGVEAWVARRRFRTLATAVRSEPPDTGIGAEAPIRKTSEDRLRRADFADRIATVLSELSPQQGRVFAIRGGWGFGKSSLKNLIAERLDSENDTPWLDFNPWQWGDSESISRALFSQIADALGGEHAPGALERAEALRRYGAILTGSGEPIKKFAAKTPLLSTVLTNGALVALVTGVGFEIPTVVKFAAFFGVAAIVLPILGPIFSFFGPDRTNDSLDKIRKSLEDRLRQLGRPLIVFVDDIDRLEPDQIRMLLRQVKANANLPNIVFVLLFQSSIVERALGPVADGDGRAFLEKIVQASFDLPPVPVSMIHQLFAEELQDLAGAYATEANGFSGTRWGNALIGCIQPMLRNLRDTRRLISSIAVHLPLHTAGNVFEVNLVDFLVLEALRVFEPDLHKALFQKRELVLQEWRSVHHGQQEADKAEAAQLLMLVSEERRIIVQNALKELFPPFEWAYGGTHYAEGWHQKWLDAKRVCTERYFPRYFELQTAPGEMSESRFAAFLKAAETEVGLVTAIADVESEGLLPSLAARFDESVDRLPVENAAVLLSGMFVIGQKFAGRNAGDSFNSPWISTWRAANWFLKRIPMEKRGGLALQALRQTTALSVAAILIHLSDPADQQNQDREAFDPALGVDTVEEMKTEWLRLMRNRAADGDALIAEPDLISQLYRWKKYSGTPEELRAWVTAVIQTDQGFARLAARMMSRGTVHSAGDRVSRPHNSFHKETVADLIGIEVAMARSNAIEPSEFPEDEEALRTLQNAVRAWTEQAAAASVD